MSQTFDYVILGTGQATGTLLGRLIPEGGTIAVIEGGRIGGSCVNYGCTPTKTLVASARAAHMARRGEEFGFKTGDITIDFDRVRERMNKIRNSSSNGLENWMKNTDSVTLFKGWGKFTGPKSIQAGEHTIKGETIFVNTGTRPFKPPLNGIDDVPWMDSAGLLDLKELPEHLVILGGGYIGCELGQVYRRLGSRVTILQRDNQLMPREDSDLAETVEEILQNEGIEVKKGTEAIGVSESDDGITVSLNNGKEVHGSHLLVAAGRRPNSTTINPDAAGIMLDKKGFIKVDDHCRTTAGNIFAVGDVNGEGAFTHTSVNDAEIVLDLLFCGDRAISKRNMIYSLFTDPPLGRVGMTEKEAVAAGYNVLRAIRPMSKISRAKEMGETQGFAKLLVDADTDLILGASILGPGGDEIINMFAAIMHSEIPCREYRKVVLVHPTVSELMPWVLDGLEPVS
ncbi:mercuric reductase [Rhodohalobacter mucosus]|uniref:Pyruvate/2-oxoglutarate dehydrogenase complex dihydrolipoamide dehydrogenase n=1 Tax=Rhodohalobacter mucosus TaxID=2079485 RepID=A0A316TUA1_9BACT|nr:mercuric reductase [Rhodohalobacter mucosus]PWN07398.1 pyruvate/2-oxoglutarate dehydrogenase complex dihydrolipoamide dehydrogenase [Rhodohalobacter mucosus]